MKTTSLIGLLLCCASLLSARPEQITALIAPDGQHLAGNRLELQLITLNGDGMAPPRSIQGILIVGRTEWPLSLTQIDLEPFASGNESAARVTRYECTVPRESFGKGILEVQLPGGRIARSVIEISSSTASNATALSSAQQPELAKLERAFEDRLSAHEPIYFIYGTDAPGAKFQFSFKYRLFTFSEGDSDSLPKSLHFGFTQRSLWDIDASSSPFYDTSYMPELIFESLAPERKGGGVHWLGYQAGYRHESNGRDGPISRSLNIASFRTGFSFGNLDSWYVILMPEVWTYIGSLSDNDDLKDYRGYGQLKIIAGGRQGIQLVYTGIAGRDFEYFTHQADLTFPIRTRLFDFKTYFLMQYFNGYAESLLSYSEESETVRFGISLVR